MELKFSKTENIVGVFVIFISILLLTTIIMIGRGKDWFKKYNTYYTEFEESYNLEVNQAVKLFKADIGKITKILNRIMSVTLHLEVLKHIFWSFRKKSRQPKNISAPITCRRKPKYTVCAS